MTTHPSVNIPAGTKIVTRAPVHGSGGSLVHPRGAVGIITRTPVGGEDWYHVRFPDGFTSTLTLQEFEILERFKDRLEGAPASADFDLERFVIYRCVAGSRSFGLDAEDSDVDLRGVYLAPPHLQWSIFGAPEQFEDNATQTVLWELQKFIIMALKANPNILECIYSPLVQKITPLGEQLIGMRERFLSQLIFQTFNGYAMNQFKKADHERRVHGEVRWKHVMHLLRLLMSGAAALRQGWVPVRVEAHREQLLAVKRGELSWEDVEAWRLELHRDFDRALTETHLPERPDYEAANRFLIRARHEQVQSFSPHDA